ncbi:MAG: hypothetical protein QW091_00545 [Candidatus Micrarchaeaceae archaeon]
MAENALNTVNFLDLACIFKITPDSTLEKFGGIINASVFDAANIAGTLKQKGLITFSSGFPGPTGMQLTDAAKNLLNDVTARSTEPLDNLDDEILQQLAGGKRVPVELQSALSVVPKDLAYRIYKLYKQNMLNYELKNGNVELLLTEQGFLRVKSPKAQAGVAQPQAAMQASQAGTGAQEGAVSFAAQTSQQQAQAPTAEQQASDISQLQNELQKPKPKGGKKLLVVLLVILVIVIIAVIITR